MKPFDVIDVPGHIAGCSRCREQRLCSEGRRLTELQTDAWLDAHRYAWGAATLGASVRDDPGLHWLRGWSAAWFVVIALLATCCGHHPPRPQAAEPVPRTITVTLSCLAQEPPKPMPEGATDAQLAQAYEALRRWAWLYAWPMCRE